MTDIKLRHPNDTGREIMMRRSVSCYVGDGCSAILSADQLPGFVSRVRAWMGTGYSERASCDLVGLRGAAAAQVLAALAGD
jgi:hypothetical protein